MKGRLLLIISLHSEKKANTLTWLLSLCEIWSSSTIRFGLHYKGKVLATAGAAQKPGVKKSGLRAPLTSFSSFAFGWEEDLVPTYVDTWKKWAFERMRRRLPWPKSRKSSGNWSLSSLLRHHQALFLSLPNFYQIEKRPQDSALNHRFLILSTATSQ